jgi:hypothetical protein
MKHIMTRIINNEKVHIPSKFPKKQENPRKSQKSKIRAPREDGRFHPVNRGACADAPWSRGVQKLTKTKDLRKNMVYEFLNYGFGDKDI